MHELVDTHCHIQSVEAGSGEAHTRRLWEKADGLKAEDVIGSAKSEGVTRMVCVGCDLEDSRLAVSFAQDHEGTWSSIGIHPHEAQHYAGNTPKLTEFSDLVNSDKVVAIGECGLDYFYEHSPKDAQVEVLRFQLELAAVNNLPVIFHVRNAFDDFWPVYDSIPGIKGVLHSFTDSIEHLNQAVERGLYIGVNGIATFTKDPEQIVMYRTIPDDSLVLETDAPFLTPTPYRGNVNEPKRVVRVAEFLADLKTTDFGTIAELTTRNARRLFSI